MFFTIFNKVSYTLLQSATAIRMKILIKESFDEY